MERDQALICEILTQMRDGITRLADFKVDGYDLSTVGQYIDYLVREDYVVSGAGTGGFDDRAPLQLTDKGFDFIGSNCA